jgi:hypothetical protein
MLRFRFQAPVQTSLRQCGYALTAACLSWLVIAPAATAQTIGGGDTSGVAVDADGVLRRKTQLDPTGELSRQRAAEALTKLDRDVARKSPLRKVSLTRL